MAGWPRTGTACLNAHCILQQQCVSLCAPSAWFTPHAGYGDITPVTFLETGVVIIFQVVGVGYFGYLLNTISKPVSKKVNL